MHTFRAFGLPEFFDAVQVTAAEKKVREQEC